MKTNEELRKSIVDILSKGYNNTSFIFSGPCVNELMQLVNSELNEAYQDGAAAAQSTACAEIARNYVAIMR